MPKKIWAPGLRAKTGLQVIEIGPISLHPLFPGFHLVRINIFVRTPNGEKIWFPGSTARYFGIYVKATSNINSVPGPLKKI